VVAVLNSNSLAVFFRIQEDSDPSAHGMSLLLLSLALFNFTGFCFLLPTYLQGAIYKLFLFLLLHEWTYPLNRVKYGISKVSSAK